MNLPWKILLIGVTLQACFDLGLSEENNALEGAENLPDTRRLLKPQFIEFTRYIQVFNKHYASMKETVVRRLIYLGRAMQAFISSIQYKSRKSSYYLKVNQMSDWTKDETSKMFMTTEGNINLDDDIDEDDTDEEDELDEMEDRVERTKRDVEETKGGEEEQKLPDKVYVDHRQSPCYKPPKSQKKCGSCWVCCLTKLILIMHNNCASKSTLLTFLFEFYRYLAVLHFTSGSTANLKANMCPSPNNSSWIVEKSSDYQAVEEATIKRLTCLLKSMV